MSTRALVTLGLAATVLAGLLAAFLVRAPSLDAHYEPAIVTYEDANAVLNDMKESVSGVAGLYGEMDAAADDSVDRLTALNEVLSELSETAERERASDEQHRAAVDELFDLSKRQSRETEDVLATVLSNMLGDPIGQSFGERSVVKVYSLKEAGYRGYMAKVKLTDPKAVKLVLSGDRIGDKGETTGAAAKRTGAVLAINAGGFAKGKDGLLYPMGVTVVDGEIKTFYQVGLSFIGFNEQGKLVGGEVNSRNDVEALNVRYGATFVPTLLKDGKKLTIPKQWKNKKEPRTLIGHFSNGDLLFIVIDGRQQGYSSGVTLEEAQRKLLEWNVRDAYNLDGGGSSAFVYNGKLLNSPSDGQQRKVVSNFVVLP